jgi:hypothetical protein
LATISSRMMVICSASIRNRLPAGAMPATVASPTWRGSYPRRKSPSNG